MTTALPAPRLRDARDGGLRAAARGVAVAMLMTSLAVRDAAAQPAPATTPTGDAAPTVPPTSSAPTSNTPTPAATLSLPAVLQATARHHPSLRAANAKVAAAKAKLLASLGAFDPKLQAEAGAAPLGKTMDLVGGVGVSQQTGLGGLQWKGGYRIGADHPVYAGKSVTASAGEVFAAARLPILRGRALDPERAERTSAELDVAIQEQELRAKRLALLEKAGKAWVKWRVAAAKFEIEGALFAIARRRAEQIEASVRRGAAAEVVRLDNERLLASRKERLVEAERAARSAALQLSLFARDAGGAPRQLSAASTLDTASTEIGLELPHGLRPSAEKAQIVATSAQVEALAATWIEEALARRPEPQALRHLAARMAVAQRLAETERQPGLDLEVDAGFGLGEAQRYGADEWSKTGIRAGGRLVFTWPWPMRKARGSARAAQASRDAVDAELQLWGETIRVEVQDALLALRASRERLLLARQAANAAQTLEVAERRKFELGQSDLVVVNLRETATADAQTKAAEAWGELQGATLRALSATAELDALP